MKIRFKRNESFYIREGWLQKAITAIKENEDVNVFSTDHGVEYLGIGSNMVKSLRYWLIAAGIIDSKKSRVSLTTFGEMIYKYDPYIESNFVLFIIHMNLCLNMEECPIFYFTFISNLKRFTKEELNLYVLEKVKEVSEEEPKRQLINDDINVFIKTYLNEDKESNPENNYVSPLSNLNLLNKKRDYFIKEKPAYKSLSYLNIFYYLLIKLKNKKQFVIEDTINCSDSPLNIFNIDKNMYLQYLDDMRKNGLITINKTAGLNTIYIEKFMTLRSIFGKYFED